MSGDGIVVVATAVAAFAAMMSAFAAFFSARYARQQANAQERLLAHEREALEQQRRLQTSESFRFAISLMEEVRKDRATLRDFVERRTAGSVVKLDEDGLIAADRVCRQFDILGLLDRRELIDRNVVVEFYAGALIELYENVLRDYMNQLRRGGTHFWELTQLYERMKTIRSSHPHPLEGGKDSWPDDQQPTKAA